MGRRRHSNKKRYTYLKSFGRDFQEMGKLPQEDGSFASTTLDVVEIRHSKSQDTSRPRQHNYRLNRKEADSTGRPTHRLEIWSRRQMIVERGLAQGSENERRKNQRENPADHRFDRAPVGISGRFYDRSRKQRRMWCLISMRQSQTGAMKVKNFLSSFSLGCTLARRGRA